MARITAMATTRPRDLICLSPFPSLVLSRARAQVPIAEDDRLGAEVLSFTDLARASREALPLRDQADRVGVARPRTARSRCSVHRPSVLNLEVGGVRRPPR